MKTCFCRKWKNKILELAAIFCAALFSSSAFAGTGIESMQFLKIKPSARAASLGDGFVSIANDANAVFYNPAGLTYLNAMEISLMHMVYLADTNYEYGAFVLPVGEKLRIGAYVVYLNYGSIGRSNEDGSGLYLAGTDSYTPYDFAGAVCPALWGMPVFWLSCQKL